MKADVFAPSTSAMSFRLVAYLPDSKHFGSIFFNNKSANDAILTRSSYWRRGAVLMVLLRAVVCVV